MKKTEHSCYVGPAKTITNKYKEDGSIQHAGNIISNMALQK